MPPVGGSTSRKGAPLGRCLASFTFIGACAFGGCAHARPSAAIHDAAASPARAATSSAAAVVVPKPANPTPASASTTAAVPASTNAVSIPPRAASTAPRTAGLKNADATAILSVSTAPSVVHAGDTVAWDVRTTPDIVTVTAHVSAYNIPLHRIGPGHFALNFAIPSNVPPVFHGTYELDVTGAASSGATAKRTVAMTFR